MASLHLKRSFADAWPRRSRPRVRFGAPGKYRSLKDTHTCRRRRCPRKQTRALRAESSVTKKEIVKQISEEIGLTQLKTKEIVQKTFDAIVETLVEEKRIELRNFGVFEVKKRAARKARNPRTGDKVFVPEKYVVTFKPGKEMEEKVRQLEEAAAKEALGKQT